MSTKVQIALSSAACLGATSFDIKIVFRTLPKEGAGICEPACDTLPNTLEEFEQTLDVAVEEGLLDNLGSSGRYKFTHDRIRESAYALLPQCAEKKCLHLHVGRQLRGLLSERASDAPEADRLLLLSAYHLDLGSELIAGREERMELVKLNQLAAELAFEKSALLQASEFLTAGLEILGLSRWSHDYELTLKMTNMLAHVWFCFGRLEESRRRVKEVLGNSRSLADKLGVYRCLVLILFQEGKGTEAIDLLIFVLNQLGVPFPKRFLKLRILMGYMELKRKLRAMSDEDLLNHPATCMDDERLLDETADFIALLGETSTLIGAMDYLALAMLHYIHFNLKYGYRKGGSLCMAGSAFFHATFGDLDLAFRYRTIALQLAEKEQYPSQDARTYTIIYCFVNHWKNPYHDGLEPLLRANRMFMDVGSVEYLYFSLTNYFAAYYNCGLRLDFIRQDMRRSLELLEDYGQSHFIALSQPFAQLLHNLVGASEDPLLLTGEAMDQEECLREWSKTRNMRALQGLYLCQLFLAHYFEDLQLAQEIPFNVFSEAEEGPTPWRCPRILFQGLTAFSLAKRTGRRRNLRRGRSHLRKLERILERGNPNCYHMVLLLKAECISFNTDKDTVRRAYNEAIKSAAKSGFTQSQALANERAGKYFLERGDDSWAITYLSCARDLYAQWGAMAKVRHLETKYQGWLNLSSSDVQDKGLKARTRLDDMTTDRHSKRVLAM